jgi:plasmid maintenance system antidote protein VapI
MGDGAMKASDVPELTHVAEFIEEEMAARGWSLRDLVFNMRRYKSEHDWAVNMLAVEMFMSVREPSVIIGDMAEEFATAFGASADLFTNLHESWRKQQLERERGEGGAK